MNNYYISFKTNSPLHPHHVVVSAGSISEAFKFIHTIFRRIDEVMSDEEFEKWIYKNDDPLMEFEL